LLEEEVRKGTGGYAECIEIGNGEVSSIFSPMSLQVDEACKKIQEHPVFGNREFNIVGLSQGALIGRYIVESCDTKEHVRNLITVGGPNNGFDFEHNCDHSSSETNIRCEIQERITAFPLLSPYSKVIQSTIGPSNYFKDSSNMEEYV
jgi:hypothetical protein